MIQPVFVAEVKARPLIRVLSGKARATGSSMPIPFWSRRMLASKRYGPSERMPKGLVSS